MSPHKITLFSEVAHETHDNHFNNTISVTKVLPQIIAIGYENENLKQKM